MTGYFCNFNVYVGRPSDRESTEVGLGERVVLQLCRPLQEARKKAKKAPTDHRGFPEALKNAVLPERGQYMLCQRGSLVAIVWKDKKNVKMLSTMCDPKQTVSVEIRQKDGRKIMVTCPDAVVQYNKYMVVDKGDQLRHYYRICMIFEVCIASDSNVSTKSNYTTYSIVNESYYPS